MAKSNSKPCTCIVHDTDDTTAGIARTHVGCGKTCTTGRYAPGHDAQTKSVLIKAHRAGLALEVTDMVGGVVLTSPLDVATQLGWSHFLLAEVKPRSKSTKNAPLVAEIESWTWADAKAKSRRPAKATKAA